jgi:hypothetical protein
MVKNGNGKLTNEGQDDGKEWGGRNMNRSRSFNIIQQVNWKITIKMHRFINVKYNQEKICFLARIPCVNG